MSVFNYKYSPNDVEKMLPVASEEGVVCVDLACRSVLTKDGKTVFTIFCA